VETNNQPQFGVCPICINIENRYRPYTYDLVADQIRHSPTLINNYVVLH
jgi:hypothetical protein